MLNAYRRRARSGGSIIEEDGCIRNPDFRPIALVFAQKISHSTMFKINIPRAHVIKLCARSSSKGCRIAEEENRETEAVEGTSRSAWVLRYTVRIYGIGSLPLNST